MPGGSQNGVSNNPNGRGKGSKNERTKQWEELGKDIIGKHADRFNEILDNSDSQQFIQAYAGILKYFKPTKMQADVSVGKMDIVFHNASKEFDFDKDGKSKKNSPVE